MVVTIICALPSCHALVVDRQWICQYCLDVPTGDIDGRHSNVFYCGQEHLDCDAARHLHECLEAKTLRTMVRTADICKVIFTAVQEKLWPAENIIWNHENNEELNVYCLKRVATQEIGDQWGAGDMKAEDVAAAMHFGMSSWALTLSVLPVTWLLHGE